MNNGLINQTLDDNVYDDYIGKIVDIFRLSSKKSSILFDMKIENYKASIRLSVLNQNGERERYNDVVLKCDYSFYHNFLMVLVKKIFDGGEIATADVVRLSDSDLVTFRMITTNNDLFSVDGLSEDDAKSLLVICKKNDEKQSKIKVLDHGGISTLKILLLSIIFTIVLFGIIFLLIRS